MMDFHRKCLTLAAAAVVALTAGSVASWAAAPTSRAALPARVARPTRALSIDNQRRVDINSLNMFVTNFGSWAYDLSTGNAGLIYPKGTDKTAFFAGGLWFGATVGGEIRTVVGEYSQEYGPGVIQRTPTDPAVAWDDPSRPEYKVYKVLRWSGDSQDTAHVDRVVPSPDPTSTDPLAHHSWSEYMAGAVPYGAPWKEWKLPDPNSPGDSVLVPGPDVSGDQMLWSVYNDADPGRHTNEAGNSAPLGLEIRQKTFAFNRQGALGNTIFLDFEIIHPSVPTATDSVYRTTLQDMYVSLWADPDLGYAGDDVVGCDTTLSLGYIYNSTNNDQIYGATPPAVGYDFFLGPRGVLGDTLPLTSFNKYINGTDPASSDATYNYMQGLNADGSPLINPVTGEPTRFFNSGDPVLGTGWLDNNAADKRMMLNSGPFQMAPGDTQHVVGAIIVGQGSSRLSSVAGLRFFDTFAQLAFDKAFVLPSPPPTPKVEVTTDHQTATLCWDAASRLNYHEPGYAFEGYNVYQGETVAGPWKLIATYDEVNAIRVIYDEIFDLTTGQIIPQFPVAFGSDAGVAFCHTVTQDAIRGGHLNDATDYFFAVTAYSFNPSGQPKVLETSQVPLRVMPQRPALGTNPATASAAVAYEQINTSKPPSTDVISVNVVDLNVVTGHIYKVTFQPTPPPATPVTVGPDTATVLYSWSLTDSTTGDVLLSNQLNRRGDLDYRVADGIQVVENGKYFPALQDVVYQNNNTAHPRALTGVSFGLGFFFTGADYGINFFGSTLDPAATPDSFTTVQIRFSHTATQKAYRFVRMQTVAGTAPPAYPNRGYLNRGFVTVPFQVWDVVHNVQLDAAVLEKEVTDDAGNRISGPQQLASSDSTWDPTADGDGGREFIFIYSRPYSDTPKAELAVDGSILAGTVPVMYMVAPALRTPDAVVDDGDALEFIFAVPANSNDIYVINTSKLVRGNAALAKQGLDRIRAVPNPYYNRSRYELSQFSRIVRFINLPEAATIRIFSLSGQLVRTLHKTDPTNSVLDWDLQTENRLPVASGVYVFHVESPGVGTTFGRLVVFMEKERLNTF
jgi:hypothetical protein